MIELSVVGSIAFLLGNMFRLYIVHCFMSIFCENDKNVAFRRILYVLFFVINSAGSLYIGWAPIMNVLSNILGVCAIAVTYSGKVRNKLLFAFAIVALSIACEDIAFYVIIKASLTWTIILGILLSNMTAYLLVQVLKRIVEHKRGEHIFIKEWSLIICIPVFSIFMSAVVLDNCTSEPIIAAGCTCLVVINLLAFYLFDRLHKMHRMEMEVALLDQQNKALENEMNLIALSNDKVKRLNHDMNNHLFAIEQLAKQDDSEDIVVYVRSLKDSFCSSYKYVTTGNTLLDGFINMKLEEADKCGAQLFTDIRISNDIRIDEKDISILMGNLLDNAVEALKKCDPPKMIRIIIKEEPGIVAIKVENTYNGKLNVSNGHIVSSKENANKHGLGLKNVSNVVDDYNGSLYANYENDIFSINAVLFTKQ